MSTVPSTSDVVFTQFLRPHGRTRPMWIVRSRETAARARALVAAGCRLDIEQLGDGTISMTVECDDDVISIRLCENGPPVEAAVDALVDEAYGRVVKAQE